MSMDWEALGSEGIRFLASMGASGAREALRRVDQVERRAEQADMLVEQAERGMCPDPEQLSQLAAGLRQAAAMIKAGLDPLLSLAEEVQAPVGMVNVSQAAERMAHVLRAKADRLGLGLALRGTDRPAYAASNVFFLQNLLHAGLDLALDSCAAQGADKAHGPVEAMVRQEQDGASVELVCPLPLLQDPVRRAKLTVLARSLAATLELDERHLRLALPSRSSLVRSLTGE